MQYLKQSASVTIRIGPFLDEDDGKTQETGLTISQADIRLSKNGGNFAQSHDSSGATHDEKGWYYLTLDTTDTNTLGRLDVMIHESGALPVWREYMVVKENWYDTMCSSAYLFTDVTKIGGSSTAAVNSAVVFDTDFGTNYDTGLNKWDTAPDWVGEEGENLVGIPWNAAWDAEVQSEVADALAAYDPPTKAELDGGLAGLNDPTAAAVADAVWDEASAGHTDAGKAGAQLWTDIDAILTDTNEMQGKLPSKSYLSGSDDSDGGLDAEARGEINTECKDAMDTYDPPTKAELDSGFAGLNDLSAADVNAEVDTALADYDPPTKAELDSGLAGLNDLSAADVNAEVDTALADIHLDHLLAADYDPASKPGTATALLNELVENDGGVSRFTGNALEEGPGGGSAPTASEIADAVWDEVSTGHVDAGKAGAQLWTDIDAILEDTNEVQADDVPGLIAALNDLSAADVNDEVDTALSDYDPPTKTEMDAAFTEIKGATWSSGTDTLEHIRDKQTDIETDTQDLQAQVGTDGAGLTALPWNGDWDAEVQSECTDALNAYDPPTKAELDSGLAGLNDPTAAAVADAVWDEDVVAAHNTADTAGALLDDLGTPGDFKADVSSLATAANLQTVDDNVDAILDDTNELQSDDVPGLIAALNDLSAAQVNAEADQALADYDPPTKAELDTAETNLTAQIDANETKIDAVDTVVDAILADTGTDGVMLSAAQMNKIADHTIRRSFQSACDSGDGDTKTGRSLLGAIAKLVNKVTSSGGTLTVHEDDDETPLFTQTMTTDSNADPITSLDTD